MRLPHLVLFASRAQAWLINQSPPLRQQPALFHTQFTMPINPLTATAAELQATLATNPVASKQLVDIYLSQIARHNDYLKAIIATAPKRVLYQRATELDDERANGTVRGPLHGIPILLKAIFLSASSARHANRYIG